MPGNTMRNMSILIRLTRFNEAPAKCRGIHKRIADNHVGARLASMRPQRNAGEYLVQRQPARPKEAASMRPQRNAGEYSLATKWKPDEDLKLQ